MKVSEARKAIELKLRVGLITEDEASYQQRRISQIQARHDLSWNQKKELYAVFG